MKSKLKLAIYEACENGVISAEDAQTYLNFVECADLDDAEDVTVLTEMVDAISCADDEAVCESAEEYVLDYLMEKAEKAEKASLKDKLTKKKADPEKKSAKLKAKIAANKGKILKGAAGANGNDDDWGDGADGMNESVEALIYESVECGDITVSEAAGLLELLAE